MKRVFLLLLSVGIMSSCSQEDDFVPEKVEVKGVKEVALTDGVLSFSSKEHLGNVTREITNRTDMSSWYGKAGFTSLLERQKSVTSGEVDQVMKTGELGRLSNLLVFRGSGENRILEKAVDDPRLAAVLNSNGYVIVADSAYHIDGENVVSIKFNGDRAVLASFLKNVNIEGAKINKVVNEQLKNARTQDFQNTNGDRRIVAEFKRHNAGVYQSLVVKITYLKKNWIGWSGTAAPYLSFTASGTYQKGFDQGIPFSGSRSGSNVEEVNMFVDEGTLFLQWGATNGHMYCITPHETFNRSF